MKELWLEVAGFDAYEVSNLGRVRRSTPSRGTRTGKVLKAGTKDNGRLVVCLTRYGKRSMKQVHRLVAEAFIPNPWGLPEVNHLGPLSDCRAIRLEWRSTLGNFQHAVRNNLCKGDGVYKIKRDNTWEARYNPSPNKTVRLGHFPTKKEALAARKLAVENMEVIL